MAIVSEGCTLHTAVVARERYILLTSDTGFASRDQRASSGKRIEFYNLRDVVSDEMWIDLLIAVSKVQ
jgi:hypothetical protein